MIYFKNFIRHKEEKKFIELNTYLNDFMNFDINYNLTRLGLRSNILFKFFNTFIIGEKIKIKALNTRKKYKEGVYTFILKKFEYKPTDGRFWLNDIYVVGYGMTGYSALFNCLCQCDEAVLDNKMQNFYSKSLKEIRKKEEKREKIKEIMKDVDPYGEENWMEENYNIKTFEEFKFSDKNETFKVEMNRWGWNCIFRCAAGKGNALLFDNNTPMKSPIKLKEGEMFLFGIDVTPTNKGIGKLFLKEIFNHFDLNKVYIPSSKDHPVWNKIATKTDKIVEMGSVDSTIFTINREQLLKMIEDSFLSEGFKTKLATLALAGALTVGTPACNLVPSRVKEVKTEQNKNFTNKIDIYYVKTPQENFHIMISKSGKVVSVTYYVSTGKTVVTHNHVYVDNDVNKLYYYRNGWNGKFYATDDPNEIDEDFDVLDLNKLKVWKETPNFKLLEKSWSSDLLILVKKGKLDPNGAKTVINGIDLGFFSYKGRVFLIKTDADW